MYHLRPARLVDAPFLCAVKLAGLRPYVEQVWGWEEAEQQRRFLESFDPSKLQVICVGSDNVGFLHVVHQPDSVRIEGIYIEASHRGRGIGSAVLEDVLAAARASRRTVRLQVLKLNPARSLYERLGFRVIETTATHFKMEFQAHA